MTGAFIDFHTHLSSGGEICCSSADVVSCYSLSLMDGGPELLAERVACLSSSSERVGDLRLCYVTLGLHPWDADRTESDGFVEWLEGYLSSQCTETGCVLGIGECGLDRRRAGELDVQRAFFTDQLVVARKLRLPVVIHCVRCWSELFACFRTAWWDSGYEGVFVIHGAERLRGSVVAEVVRCGGYLSLGARSVDGSPEWLRGLPMDRILFESDGRGPGIEAVYNAYSTLLERSVTSLRVSTEENFRTVLGSCVAY